MRTIWPLNNPGGYWLTPAVGGLLLILVGVLIFIDPDLVAYFIGSMFMLGGVLLLGGAWKMRKQVTYRRIDEVRRFDDDAGEL